MLLSVQLSACGDVGVHHKEVELFLLAVLVDSTQEHTAGVNSHHSSRREVGNGDKSLADEVLRLIISVDSA